MSEQSQIIEVGIAKQVDTCGAMTESGRPCSHLFDKDRAKFCVFHSQGISRRDVVRSVSYLEGTRSERGTSAEYSCQQAPRTHHFFNVYCRKYTWQSQ